MRSIFALSVIGLFANVALAQKASAFRCTEDGKVTYSDRACPGAVEVRMTPTRGIEGPGADKSNAAQSQRAGTGRSPPGPIETSMRGAGLCDACALPDMRKTE
jgi:hypothetical protein